MNARRYAMRATLQGVCAVLLTGACARPAATVAPRPGATACFPVEQLASRDRVVAERVLLEFGDREGLYTLASGIKPISSDVRDMQVRIAPTLDTAALARLEQLRRVSAALSCGELGVFVQVFTAATPGRDSATYRNATLVLYHRQSVRALLERHATFFATLGLSASADPRDVLSAVENAPRDARWRGYGYLFGYPDDAVDFFVRAGIEGDSTKKLVPRDFRRIETFYKFADVRDGPPVNSTFVYAVPKGAPESDGDRRLQQATAPIYARYVRQRGEFIAPDSSGAVALWRRWLGAK